MHSFGHVLINIYFIYLFIYIYTQIYIHIYVIYLYIYKASKMMTSSSSLLLLLGIVNICLDLLIYYFFFPLSISLSFLLDHSSSAWTSSCCIWGLMLTNSENILCCFPSWRIFLLSVKSYIGSSLSISKTILICLLDSIFSFEKSAVSLFVAPLGSQPFFFWLPFFGFQKFNWCT